MKTKAATCKKCNGRGTVTVRIKLGLSCAHVRRPCPECEKRNYPLFNSRRLRA